MKKIEEKTYLRIEDGRFSFVDNIMHEIRDEDVLITLEDYNEFFEKLSSSRNYFVLKEKVIMKPNMGLWDYIDEIEVPEEELVEEVYSLVDSTSLKEEVDSLKIEIKETNSKLDNILNLLSNK